MDTVHWQKSQPKRIKCNIDSAFSSSLNKIGIGIGICVRDDDGAYVLAKTLSISPMTLLMLA